MDGIGQVDLERCIHRTRNTKALGGMAFVIMEPFLSRLAKSGQMERILEYRNKFNQT